MRRPYLMALMALLLTCVGNISARADEPVQAAPHAAHADKFAAYPHPEVWGISLSAPPGEIVSGIVIARDLNRNLIVKYSTLVDESSERWTNRFVNFFARKLVATVGMPGDRGFPPQSQEFRFDPTGPFYGLTTDDRTFYPLSLTAADLDSPIDFLPDGSALESFREESTRDTHVLPFSRWYIYISPDRRRTENFALIWVSRTRREYLDPDFVPRWRLRTFEHPHEDRWDPIGAGWYAQSYIHSRSIDNHLTSIGDGTYLLAPYDSEGGNSGDIIRVTADLESPFFTESDEYLRLDFATLLQIEQEARVEALRIRAEAIRSGRALNNMNLFEIADEYATRRFRELIAAHHRSNTQ